MNFLKDICKMLNKHTVLFLLGLLVLVIFLRQYSSSVGKVLGGMTNSNNNKVQNTQPATLGIDPAMPAGMNSEPAQVNGVQTITDGLPSNCNKQLITNPAELLPRDNNSEWGSQNPTGAGDLKDVNLLQAGWHAGIDTVGGSLRNANLQVRSEPPNPKMPNVSPWGNSTIEPDLMRVPLELGCGSQ